MKRWLWAALAALACATPRPIEPRVTLLLGAVPWEVAPLEQALIGVQKGNVDGIAYTRGWLSGMLVVISLTGVGKTNTGLVVGVLYNEFRPRRVIFTGTGARVDPGLEPGDVIVAQQVFFHDAGNLTEDGMQLLPVFGPGERRADPVFAPDPELFSAALQAAESYAAPEVSVDGTSHRVRVRAGRIATGDLFGVNRWKLAELREKLRADLLEMEGASLAQSCQTLGVPWLLIRAGSDPLRAGDASADYLKYGPIAARQAALFTLQLVEQLARSDAR